MGIECQPRDKQLPKDFRFLMEVTAVDQIPPKAGLQRARLCQEEVRRARQPADSC